MNYLRTVCPPDPDDEKKRERYLKSLQSSEEAHRVYMRGRSVYIEMYVQSDTGRVTRKQLGIYAEVRADEKDGLKTEQFLGFFWTVELYEKHKGGKPPPTDIVVIKHQGVRLKGVILGYDAGRPIGVIKITDYSMLERVKSSVGATTESEQLGGPKVQMFHLPHIKRRLCNSLKQKCRFQSNDCITIQFSNAS